VISEDEYLERIVAGIHTVTTAGADVRWNEIMNGRQFDVVVRFTIGTLSYLVLVEVKNRTRRASAEDLDAFVTKARDRLASKAVFVTAAGFQRGAIQTARRHGVEVFTVSFDQSEITLSSTASYITLHRKGVPHDKAPALSIGDERPALCIRAVDLIYSDGRRYPVPDEPSQMTYYMMKTHFESGISLGSFLKEQSFPSVTVGVNRREQIKFRRPRRIRPPDDYYFPAGKVVAVNCDITGVLGRSITGTLLLEPTSFRHPVLYTNVLTGETSRFSLDQLPLGSTEVVAGEFYFGLHPLRYFYCSAIDGDLVTWHLIESFQNGTLVRATFTQKLEHATDYVPVADPKIRQRLHRRLADYLQLP
jgi:hypothetical protein